MDRPASVREVGEFYSRIARPYDRFAGSLIFSRLRRRAVAALGLEPDARVLDVGCGTGGNIPHFERFLGPRGSYLGLDASRGMLREARGRRASFDTDFLVGDAIDPPIQEPVDAIVVTFVNGVIPEPESAVDSWLSLLKPGGRIVLLDAAGRPGRSTPLDWGFATFVHLAAPPGTKKRYQQSPDQVLMERVEAAHDRLAAEAEVVARTTSWLGFVRQITATKRPGTS